LERILNSTMRFIIEKHDLRTFLWSTMAPESTEGENSPTWVKCSIHKKSNSEILMTICSFMGSYWIVLMRLQEKYRTFNFFYCFWLEIDRILMMADLVSVFWCVQT
jgi:hypothetical protein